jgi:hypothetical protein
VWSIPLTFQYLSDIPFDVLAPFINAGEGVFISPGFRLEGFDSLLVSAHVGAKHRRRGGDAYRQ